MSIHKIRESINLFIYDSKDTVQKVFRVSSMLVALLAVLSIIYFHGFSLTQEENKLIVTFLRIAFGFFVVKYLVRLFYSFQPLVEFRSSLFEGILIIVVLIDTVLSLLFNYELVHSLGRLLHIENIEWFYALAIQLYFVLILVNEIGRAGNRISSFNLSPPTLLISSFLVLISGGTLLLMLPEMTTSGTSMNFLEAMFTSISASCVTGLIVVDTATYFSLKGQMVIMLLIQLGGLNIISFASVFALIARRGIGLKHQSILQESLNAESLSASSSLFRQIFVFSLLIELLGAVLIFFSWKDIPQVASISDRVFYSIFHSISAFNNAGFSIFSNGLFEEGVRNAYVLQLVIAMLIILGGIGFTTLRDLFSFSKIRERFLQPFRTLKIDTKLSLYSAGILILLGFIVFFIFERRNTLSQEPWYGQIVGAFFQSVSTRTAGFNTVDIGAMAVPSLIFTIFLMFIGASPGSTGGGIKTNTFALIILGAWSTARGRSRLEIFKRTIPYDLLNKAFLIFFIAIVFIALAIFGLTITEPDKSITALAYEEVSAFCTVGLSTGITADLSTAGRIIIMISMFLGRVGILSLAFALGRSAKGSNYKYPKASMLIG